MSTETKYKQSVPTEYPPIPEDIDIERLVIAEVINSPADLMEAERIIDAEMFSSEERRNAWIALLKMSNNGELIDLPTAFTKLGKDFMTKEVIPNMSKVGSGASMMKHCEIVRDFSIRRKAYFSAINLLLQSSCSTSTISDILNTPTELIEGIRKGLRDDRSAEKISDTINRLAEEIQQRQYDRQQGKQTRIPTGFRFLDKLTYSGFGSGQLIILAARPSIGKTAIMLQMAKEAANTGFPVSVFSLEMTNTELAQRLLFSTGEVKPIQIVRGDMEWQAFEKGAGRFASVPMYLNDTMTTIDEIASAIVLNHRQGKCGIAFIDYLGLIQHNDNRQPLHQIIAEVTKRLKRLAKECRIPIVLLCQLNRASASEKRAPQLFDLRDSGSIEQDADIVLMLERDSESNTDQESAGCVNMWIRKNRQGKAGEYAIKLQANETFTAFTETGLIQPE